MNSINFTYDELCIIKVSLNLAVNDFCHTKLHLENFNYPDGFKLDEFLKPYITLKNKVDYAISRSDFYEN